MPKPTPSRDPSSLFALRILGAIALALLILAVYLITRKGPGGAGGEERTLPGKTRSGYENRGIWRTGNARVPASFPIRGTVYDLAGQAVPGARIMAYSFQASGNQASPVGKAESNGDGRFEMHVADGSYYVTAEREGYGPTQVIAHSGEEIGLLLPRSGVVEGHVVDEQGRPVRRFSIDILSPSLDDMAAPAPFASKQFVSSDGSFKLESLPERPVFLRVTAEGYAPAFSEAMKLYQNDRRTEEITLTAGCKLTGKVVDEDGAPLTAVYVDAELRKVAGVMGPSSIDATTADETDDSGRFELTGVPFGDVMLRAYDGTHAASTTSVKVESCDSLPVIQLRMTAGATLSGIVRDTDGNPIAGAKIALSHRAIGFVNTISDAQGHYTFDKLPEGGMRLVALRGGQRTTALVTLYGDQPATKDLVFSTEGKGAIEGIVRAGDRPLPGMSVTVMSNEGNGTLGSRHPITGPDGKFTISGLQDGAYAVLLPSINRVTSARIEEGSTEKVEIDVAASQERRPLPQIPTQKEPPAAPEGSQD
ncbi:MAG: carboxypeptidase-like regulatory domain-containing protein [Polyangiaceae bacterium]